MQNIPPNTNMDLEAQFSHLPQNHFLVPKPMHALTSPNLQTPVRNDIKREDVEEASVDAAMEEQFEEHYVKQVVSFMNCKQCSYTCTKRDRMVRHVKNVHLKEKPHACHLCTSSFGRKDKLKRHLDTVHSTEKPFKCHICSNAFNRKDKLRGHVQGVHFKTLAGSLSTTGKVSFSNPSTPPKPNLFAPTDSLSIT